jgi:hypothetical protein
LSRIHNGLQKEFTNKIQTETVTLKQPYKITESNTQWITKRIYKIKYRIGLQVKLKDTVYFKIDYKKIQNKIQIGLHWSQ